MNTKHLLIATLVILTAGCASTRSPVTDNDYVQLGAYSAALQRCFESGDVTPKMYSDASRAIKSNVYGRSGDISRVESQYNKAYAVTVADSKICRSVEAMNHTVIGMEKDHSDSEAANQQELKAAVKELSNIKIPDFRPYQPSQSIVCNRPGYYELCK